MPTICSAKLRELLELSAFAGGYTLEELQSRDQHRSLMHARRIFVKAARDKGYSYTEIGILLHRHHSSVMALAKGKANGKNHD
jgi:hypothetical protein